MAFVKNGEVKFELNVRITGFGIKGAYGLTPEQWRDAMELGFVGAPKKDIQTYGLVQRMDDKGNIFVIQPAGLPPDVRAKNENDAKNRQRKTKLVARLKKKLEEKHSAHTGDECDECFWDVALNRRA